MRLKFFAQFTTGAFDGTFIDLKTFMDNAGVCTVTRLVIVNVYAT